MASIREYFDNDVKVMSSHVDWQYGSEAGGPKATIRAKIAMDFEANAKYWYFYVPTVDDLAQCVALILAQKETGLCALGEGGDGVRVESGFADYSERATSETLVFTKRTVFYVDALLSIEERQGLSTLGTNIGMSLIVRDREYAQKRSEYEKPLAFISHDSRDKDDLVRGLAHELIKLMCPVWYDEYSLRVGDSLRENIEQGLKEARKCVIVLSPNFLGNKGWGRAEFDAVFTREILEQKNVILPVWHNVGAKEVYEYSPGLANKVGLPTTLGVEEVARRLSGVIRQLGV